MVSQWQPMLAKESTIAKTQKVEKIDEKWL
jgi:hypothetical protein